MNENPYKSPDNESLAPTRRVVQNARFWRNVFLTGAGTLLGSRVVWHTFLLLVDFASLPVPPQFVTYIVDADIMTCGMSLLLMVVGAFGWLFNDPLSADRPRRV